MVRSVAAPEHSMPYGAPELKAVARSFMLRATASASLLWMLVFAALVVFTWLVPAARILPVPLPPDRHVVHPYVPQNTPRVIDSEHGPRVARDRGEMVPVPDELRKPPDILTAPPSTEGVSSEGTILDPTEGAAPRDESANEPPPPLRTEFRLLDNDPQAIIHDPPVYPDIAREAGVEGRVVIALLIDRTGHVRDSFVERSVLMLDSAVVEATRRWVFQPALIDNRPVMAWVRVTVDFRLH